MGLRLADILRVVGWTIGVSLLAACIINLEPLTATVLMLVYQSVLV